MLPKRQTVTISKTLRLIAGCCLAILCVVNARPAFGGPPIATDDPETPGRGGWEINISHTLERTRDELFMESPLIDINYGWLENDQWKIEFAAIALDPDDEPNHWGVSDVELGWKYRFLEEEQHGIAASIYPQPLIPTGNHGLGLSDGRFETLLPIEVGKHFCDDTIFVYGEVGYNAVFGNSAADEIIYGLAVACEATDELDFMCEVGGVTFPRGDDPDDTFFNVGFKYELNENVAFIGSSGRSFHNRNRGTPELLTYVGVQITLGGESCDSE
ncbi:MAG: hypothetical protein CMJ48_04730 [Planctomycetaceae bacterium]|nr:hypothetical protein [Planctomycetaceae bacterium]